MAEDGKVLGDRRGGDVQRPGERGSSRRAAEHRKQSCPASAKQVAERLVVRGREEALLPHGRRAPRGVTQRNAG